MMNQAEEAKLLEQLEQWNNDGRVSPGVSEAIEAIPEQERGYLLTVKLSRAYSNLAVLGDHGEHGTDSEVDGNLIQYAIRAAGVRSHPGRKRPLLELPDGLFLPDGVPLRSHRL